MQVDSQFCRKINPKQKQIWKGDFRNNKKCEREFKNVHDLICLLKDELKRKRHILVLDDIWRIKAWDYIKHAFSKWKEGKQSSLCHTQQGSSTIC